MPAGSRRSNIGLPNISQNVLRGCGSSVYSMPIAQPLSSAYLSCALICLSVRSGRNENVPWVIRMMVLRSLKSAAMDGRFLILAIKDDRYQLEAVGVGTKSDVSVEV